MYSFFTEASTGRVCCGWVTVFSEAQKTYFATRMPDDLRRSKRLETELDREIKKVRNRIEQMKDTQTDLNFGHEG